MDRTDAFLLSPVANLVELGDSWMWFTAREFERSEKGSENVLSQNEVIISKLDYAGELA